METLTESFKTKRKKPSQTFLPFSARGMFWRVCCCCALMKPVNDTASFEPPCPSAAVSGKIPLNLLKCLVAWYIWSGVHNAGIACQWLLSDFWSVSSCVHRVTYILKKETQVSLEVFFFLTNLKQEVFLYSKINHVRTYWNAGKCTDTKTIFLKSRNK